MPEACSSDSIKEKRILDDIFKDGKAEFIQDHCDRYRDHYSRVLQWQGEIELSSKYGMSKWEFITREQSRGSVDGRLLGGTIGAKRRFWLPGVSNLRPAGHIWPRMAMNVAQHKIINLLKTFFFFFAHQLSLVFVYLMCGPRQLFFQSGADTPKVWTPLELT